MGLVNSCTIRKSINPPIEYTITLREGQNIIGVDHILNRILNEQKDIEDLCEGSGSIKPFRKAVDSVSRDRRFIYSKYPTVRIGGKGYYVLKEVTIFF